MAVASRVKGFARQVLPAPVAEAFRHVRYQVKTLRLKGLDFRLELPNRRVLEDDILPALAADPAIKRVLFVGCRWYTKIYGAIFANSEYWTIEIDPDQAKFGAGGGRHIVDSYLNLSKHVKPEFFDAIVINGVFGWGIDNPADTETALAETLQALRPGGVMVIGYNDTDANHPSFVDVPSANLAKFAPHEVAKLGHHYVTPGDPGAHTFTFFRKP